MSSKNVTSITEDSEIASPSVVHGIGAKHSLVESWDNGESKKLSSTSNADNDYAARSRSLN
jgi:hypothetical protein